MIIIDVSKLSYSKETIIEDVVNFDSDEFKCHPPLLAVKNCEVFVKIHRYEDFIYVDLNLKADVILQCSYSLISFASKIKTKEEFHFASFKEEGDDDLIIYKGKYIELDKYIFDAISASIPISPVAPKAKLPPSGKGYRVISSDDYQKEKENKSNSKFDVLKNLEFDD